MELETREFRMSRSRYFLTMLLHDVPWWLLGFVIFVIAMGLTGATVAWWYAVIMVMLAFVIIPFIMWIPYIHYGFKRLTATNVTPHKLTVRGSGLLITFPETEQSYTVPLQNLKGYKIMPSGILIPSSEKDDGWLWLQPSAFDSPEEMQGFLKALYPKSNTEDKM